MSAFYTKPVTMLPGGIPFTDPRVGTKKFPGMEVSSEDEQIGRIISWRLQNPNVYPVTEPKWLDTESVRLELRKYQVDRLGNNRQFFTNGTSNDIGIEVKPREPSRVCECGSASATAEYCKTCSGGRLTGWKCNSCGKVRGL